MLSLQLRLNVTPITTKNVLNAICAKYAMRPNHSQWIVLFDFWCYLCNIALPCALLIFVLFQIQLLHVKQGVTNNKFEMGSKQWKDITEDKYWY